MAGHPTDADREAGALPVLMAALKAARAGDGAALAACYSEDVVWLDDDGVLRGSAAAERHVEIAVAASEWAEPQQHGARAALRWVRRGSDGAIVARGAIVVEVRRGQIIFAATS